MRFFTPVLAIMAAVASAQTSTSQQNAITIPNGGLQVSAGENTIHWTKPSSGTVTIKLQQGSGTTPTSGYVLASGIPASSETATFNIPADVVNSHQYVFEIIDDSNPDNYNFSTNFAISGATGTATGFPTSGAASSTLSTAVSSATSTASVTSSASTSSASSASSSSSSSSGSSSTTAMSSSSSSSASESVPTSTGAASLLSVNGGLAMLVAGAVMAI